MQKIHSKEPSFYLKTAAQKCIKQKLYDDTLQNLDRKYSINFISLKLNVSFIYIFTVNILCCITDTLPVLQQLAPTVHHLVPDSK